MVENDSLFSEAYILINWTSATREEKFYFWFNWNVYTYFYRRGLAHILLTDPHNYLNFYNVRKFLNWRRKRN